MSAELEIVVLRGGQRAIRHLRHGEVMHPSVGPWEEANLLYVRQPGLAERLVESTDRPLRILDVGLGGAANAVAALQCAAELGPPRRRLEIDSFEEDLAPLELACAHPEAFPFLAPWAEAARTLARERHWRGDGIEWRLHLGDARALLAQGGLEADLVFFDPFSPEANPSLWTRDTLASVRRCCREGALLITYSAATPTRVALLLAGFFVGAGAPVGGRSETTVAATRLDALRAPLGERWLDRWRRSSARAPHGEELDESIVREVLAHPQWRTG